MFRTAAVALIITLLAAGQMGFAQNTTQPARSKLTAEQRKKIAALWKSFLTLSNDDSKAAAKARQAILGEKDRAVAFVAEEFTGSALNEQAAAKLIADLDSEVWRKRQAATEKLKAEGICQADLVLAAIKFAKSPEVRLRLKEINEAHEKRFAAALQVLISVNSEISWATAHKIIRVKQEAGNSKFISLSVETFISDIEAAAEMFLSNRYSYVSRMHEGFGNRILEEEFLIVAFIENLSISIKDRNNGPLALWDIAVKLTPANPECYSRRGQLLHRLARNNEAQADLTKAIELAPEDASYRFSRSVFLLAMNKPNEALADFNKAIELSPGKSSYYLWRARVYIKLGKKKEALADLTKAIELNPDNSWYYQQRAEVYEMLGKNDKALADLAAAIKYSDLVSDKAWGYFRRAALQKKLGHVDKFVADMKKAVEIGQENPHYTNFCNELAWFFVTCEDAKFRDVKAAVEYGQKACATNPRNPAPLDTLACAYAEDNQWPKAIETQKKAIACTRDANMKKIFTDRLEGFKKHKTYLQQEAEKKKKPAPTTTQPDAAGKSENRNPKSEAATTQPTTKLDSPVPAKG